MDNSTIYSKIFSMISNLRESYSIQDVNSKEFTEICEAIDIVRITYTVTIPQNQIHKKEETYSVEFFANGKDYDEEHSLYHKLQNKTMNMSVSAQLYWDLDCSPDKDRIELYDMFGSFIYFFMTRARMNEVLLNIINKDLLTELPSLDFIQKKFDREVTSKGKSNDYAMIFVNIQNMKFYNKMYNSATGDVVLKLFGQTVQTLCNPDEYLARPGGDNFVLAVKKERLAFIIDKLEDVVIPAVEGIQEKHRHISTWRGISKDVPPVLPFNARLYHSSVALNVAKNAMHKKVLFYTEEIENSSAWAKQVVASFVDCLKNNEYIPFYQPKVQIKTGKIIGLESLVRWKKDGAILPPSAFVGILESYDLIPMLDLYMLEKTCKDIRTWIDSGITPPRISSNLSRKNLYDKNIIEKIIAIIDKYKIPVEYIEIEILETTSMDESSLLIALTKELKAHGIRVSMDDFGTGYSSLSLLKDVNADIAKIDKTFVDDCIQDKRTFILIKNMIQLAKELNMEIIAEGVETIEQAKFLLQLGCDNAQGYLYSKPIPYEAITPQLRAGKYPIALN